MTKPNTTPKQQAWLDANPEYILANENNKRAYSSAWYLHRDGTRSSLYATIDPVLHAGSIFVGVSASARIESLHKSHYHMPDKVAMADALEKQAAQLRIEAHAERPLPDFWRVGQRIRYINDSVWGWSKGDVGVVIRIREEYRDKPADKYQVFYTNNTGGDHPIFWTTPKDVELIREDAT